MKMKLLAAAGFVVLVFASSSSVRAQALITFSTPVAISSDTDVFTTGTFISAFDTGSATNTTVNGVVFTAAPSAGSTTTYGSGEGSLTFAGGYSGYGGSGNSPSGTASYNALISSAFYYGIFQSNTLTFNNLVFGRSYQFEYFCQDLGNAAGRITTLSDQATPTADTVGLNNSGQYVFGSFTASGATETIGLGTSTTGYINAIELRAVPEPSTYALMFGGLGVLAVVWRRKAAGSI